MIYQYEASGNILVSGESEVISEYYSWESDGYVLISGDSTNDITSYVEVSDGGFIISGDAEFSIISYYEIATGSISIYGDSHESNAYKPTGTINVSGAANIVYRPTYTASGTVLISNSFDVNYNVDFSHSFSYQVFQNFEVTNTFSYVVGNLPLYTFRVTGKEYYNCDYIPFCAIPNGLNRMFQEIVARNLKEVCQFLSDVNWTWPIAMIQRSVHPIESFFAIESTGIAINGLPVPTYNEFVEIPFSQIPECLQFTVVPTPTTHMGIKSEIVEANVYVAVGGITVSGITLLKHAYVGFGSISLTGEAESNSSYFTFEAYGNITLASEAEIIFSYRSHEATGGISVSGDGLALSPSYFYSGNGNIIVADESSNQLRLYYVASGNSDSYPIYAGISLYGNAEYPILVQGQGIAFVNGTSSISTPYLSEVASGGIVVDSQSLILSPYYSYEPSGSIMVDGSIEIVVASYAAEGDQTPVTLSGTASTRDSSGGSFWYTTLLTPITLYDSALYSKSGFRYTSTGNVSIYGLADSPLLWASDITMGMFAELDQFEVIFSQETTQQLNTVATTINTSCGICNAIPSSLYLQHNLQNATVLKDFFSINAFSFDENIPLYYSNRSSAWQTSFHYKGIGTSNVEEFWQVNLDWSCVNYLGEDQFSSSLWRFALYVNKVDTNSQNDLDTRIVIFFPSETICEYASRYGLDFTFNVHLRDNFVTNNFNILVDNFTIYDSIGLFNGTYWNTNTLTIRVNTAQILKDVTTYDISFVKPEVPSQFYV